MDKIAAEISKEILLALINNHNLSSLEGSNESDDVKINNVMKAYTSIFETISNCIKRDPKTEANPVYETKRTLSF
ncbi:hypothetical protein Ga0466249_000698 [Sporomusaceae bacterium BoRhaA]|jgi:hypothetical protein|uniref:hypothetical protein n=1 Tax=Pelorhabdus rhamnosifermentans TaxID=2772457 RepID=UPI001C0628B2|nr:hypothetical protein [Pelorhabdus rhamnosifermentans]MBU2699617.1 hypothetical protein [Pelorhabdus rhamnosifermentans]